MSMRRTDEKNGRKIDKMPGQTPGEDRAPWRYKISDRFMRKTYGAAEFMELPFSENCDMI